MTSVSVRYMIDDVPAAMQFYTTLLGFTVEVDASPAFAAVARDGVRLLLSGEGSSGKRPLPDGRAQVPGGWNRIHLEVADLAAEPLATDPALTPDHRQHANSEGHRRRALAIA